MLNRKAPENASRYCIALPFSFFIHNGRLPPKRVKKNKLKLYMKGIVKECICNLQR
jgi:hypothetical protein